MEEFYHSLESYFETFESLSNSNFLEGALKSGDSIYVSLFNSYMSLVEDYRKANSLIESSRSSREIEGMIELSEKIESFIIERKNALNELSDRLLEGRYRLARRE